MRVSPLPEPEANENTDKLFKKSSGSSARIPMPLSFLQLSCRVAGGAPARAYFRERAILPKTAASFGLGFAPNSRNTLIAHLKPLGYSESELVDFGLAAIRDNSYIDKFRNRVMFPIIDVRGNVIGFGGRVMDDSKPKYLNSPETAAFNKRLNLFALNFAKNKKVTR